MNLNIQLMIINADSSVRGEAWWSANRFSSVIDQVMNYSVKAACAGFCLQPTYLLTFSGVDLVRLINSILFHKKRLLKFYPQMRCVSPAVMQKINLLALGWR